MRVILTLVLRVLRDVVISRFPTSFPFVSMLYERALVDVIETIKGSADFGNPHEEEKNKIICNAGPFSSSHVAIITTIAGHFVH